MALRKQGAARNLILDAAERLVVDEGARRLTLDAVAARAGVSKGGLLYHFGTKEALLQAMVERRCTTFEDRTREQMATGGGPSDALSAYVAVALQRRADRSVAGALIAAIANDPKLLEPMREHFRRWLPQLEPEVPSFADRAIVWLATEGLWLLELLQLSPLNQQHHDEIATRLIRLAKDGKVGLVSKPTVRRRTATAAKRARLSGAVKSRR